MQSVYLDNLNDITFKSGIAIGVMTIDTLREVFNVGLAKDSAQRISAKVHEAIDALKAKKAQDIQAPSPASAADELRKFKELLDASIITQEEFDAKKKQLLGL
jgi:predicted Zn-dependent peptidase